MKRSHWWVVGTGLLGIAALWQGLAISGAAEREGANRAAPRKGGAERREERGDSVEDLMERTHEGRRSPLTQLKSQLDAAAPSWEAINSTLPPFTAMSKALTESRKTDIKDAADGYADAVKALAEATKDKNLDGARKALKALTNSCGDCHYKGGPGGELDDD